MKLHAKFKQVEFGAHVISTRVTGPNSTSALSSVDQQRARHDAEPEQLASLLRNVNTSWAVFGQASYDLADTLTLTGGVRVTNRPQLTRRCSRPRTPLPMSRPSPVATRVKLSDSQAEHA